MPGPLALELGLRLLGLCAQGLEFGAGLLKPGACLLQFAAQAVKLAGVDRGRRARRRARRGGCDDGRRGALGDRGLRCATGRGDGEVRVARLARRQREALGEIGDQIGGGDRGLDLEMGHE